MKKICYVYIMTNHYNRVLYTGMTGREEERFEEHRQKFVPSFTARYHINKVVFAEEFATPGEAAEAERKIKGWTRRKKIVLIESLNPEWDDLTGRDASLRSAIRATLLPGGRSPGKYAPAAADIPL